MAISGQQIIAIGIQNDAVGSDSLYTAFHKTKDNFATLFACSSPYTTFTGTGIGIIATPGSGTLELVNTGVTSLIEGTGIVLSGSNGNITISSTGGGNGSGGTVTTVSVQPMSLSRLWVGGDNPITSSGVILIDLATSGVTSGTYTYPTVTVDQYGRVTNIASAGSVGTVTSVVVTPGAGIQVTGSPYTTTGTINITNTGVTRLNAGTGIALSGGNGNVTVSSTITQNPGTVTSVGVTSTTLTVSTTPISTNGSLSVDLASNIPVTGILTLSGSENLAAGAAASLIVTASYFTTTTAETATLGVGVTGQIKTFMMAGDSGNMVITVTNPGWSGTGSITFDTVGQGCTLQYITNKWFCIGNNGAIFA